MASYSRGRVVHAPSMLEVRACQVITVAAEVLTKPKLQGVHPK